MFLAIPLELPEQLGVGNCLSCVISTVREMPARGRWHHRLVISLEGRTRMGR